MALEDFFGTDETVDPYAGGIGDAYTGNAISPGHKLAIAKIEELQRPLLERKNKLMEQLYEPDHLSFGGAVAQALVGFLPAILGKTLAGNAGGAIGAKAGLEGLGTYDTISKAYRADEQKQQTAEAKSLEDKYNNYETLKKTLLTGGMVRGNQEEQRKYEDTRRRPGGDIYDYEREKMALQHKYRTSEIALAKDSNKPSSADLDFAKSSLVSNAQVLYKDDPKLPEIINQISSINSEEGIRAARLAMGQRGQIMSKGASEQQQIGNLVEQSTKKVEEQLAGYEFAIKQLKGNNTGVTGNFIRRAMVKMSGDNRVSDKDVAGIIPNTLTSRYADVVNAISSTGDEESFKPEMRKRLAEFLTDFADSQIKSVKELPQMLEEKRFEAPTASALGYFDKARSGYGKHYVDRFERARRQAEDLNTPWQETRPNAEVPQIVIQNGKEYNVIRDPNLPGKVILRPRQ